MDLNPLEAGLGFAVAWGSGFVGEEALLDLRDKPLNARVVTLTLEFDAIPLGNEPVFFDNTIVGKTTQLPTVIGSVVRLPLPCCRAMVPHSRWHPN